MVTTSPPSAARSPSGVACTAEAGEDLAALWQVPVAERVASDQWLRGPRPAAQDLVALAEVNLRVLRVRERDEAGVGPEVARRPLPHVAQHLVAAEVADAAWVRADGGGGEGGLVEIGEVGRGDGVAPGMAAGGSALQVPCRGLLPLRLGGKPLAGPAGVRVGLVPADVDHRLIECERNQTAEDQLAPALVVHPPPLGGIGGAALDSPSPRLGCPQLATAIAAVFDEAKELSVADRAEVDAKARQDDLVSGTLVVVGEAAIVRTHQERTRGNHRFRGVVDGDHGAGRLTPSRRLVGEVVDQLDGLEDGLAVLRLVLRQHGVDEAPGEERVARGEGRACEDVERLLPRELEIPQARGALEEGQAPACCTGVRDGV